MSDRSQSKVPIFVFVVGAILLGAAALLSVLVTVPSPGGRTPAPVAADRDSQPKPAAADKVEARLPPAKPAPSASDTITEPVSTGALAGPGPGHRFEPLKDEASPPSAGTAPSEPAAAEPMSDADLAEIKAATRAAAEVAAAEAPPVRPDDEAERPSADAATPDPIMTAAAPHAADAEEPETSAAEPHAPASLSGATAPPVKDDGPGPEPAAKAKAEPEPAQPAATPSSAEAADDRDAATPAPRAATAMEPAATKPAPPEDAKPEPTPPAKTETAEITQPQSPPAAPEPERASPMPVEAEHAPPLPSKKVVEATPEVPKPEKAETPSPPPVKTASEDKNDKREAARSREAEAAPPAAPRQAATKPGAKPMTLGFGLLKPKTAPAPRARGKSSLAYGAVVRGAVGRHKPRGVGRGRVTVTFSIGPMGALRGVSVARSSGNSKLDQAAVSAVRSAAPFPAPPSGAGQTYSLPIYFH